MRLLVLSLTVVLALAGAAQAKRTVGSRTAPITVTPSGRWQRVFGAPHSDEVKAALHSARQDRTRSDAMLYEFTMTRLDSLPLHSVIKLATATGKETRSVLLTQYARRNRALLTVDEVIELAQAAKGKRPSVLDQLLGRPDDRTSVVANLILADYVEHHTRELSTREVVKIKWSMTAGHRGRMVRSFTRANEDRLTEEDRDLLFPGTIRAVRPAARY